MKEYKVWVEYATDYAYETIKIDAENEQDLKEKLDSRYCGRPFNYNIEEDK